MKPSIGLTESHAQEVANILSIIAADEQVLYLKTKQAHWNVKGSDFYAAHKFFEDQYDELDEIIDDIAERIRSIGHYPPATMEDILQLTRLTEKQQGGSSSKELIEQLWEDHKSIILLIRERYAVIEDEYGDVGSSDFLVGLIQKHEKMAWMLREHLA